MHAGERVSEALLDHEHHCTGFQDPAVWAGRRRHGQGPPSRCRPRPWPHRRRPEAVRLSSPALFLLNL